MTSTCKVDITQKKNMFHPFEFAFCGYSNSGKSTLIQKLIQSMSAQFDIAYLKHDAHRFNFDKKGKDTFNAYEAGARQVFINDPSHIGLQRKHQEINWFDYRNLFKNEDILFVEGYKQSDLPKIVVLDSEKQILDLQLENVLAYVGPEQNISGLDKPYFHRDNIEEIEKLIVGYFQAIHTNTPIYALVLSGGNSTRMGQDKSLLNYHSKPQYQHIYDMVEPMVDKAFVSCRKEQAEQFQGTKTLFDTYLDMGPMSGILSAQQKHPHAAWLIIACDLPFLNAETLEYLKQNRNPFKFATAFKSTWKDFPEPLCTIYEPKSHSRLLSFLGQEYKCPRKMLINSNIHLLKQPYKGHLDNINTPEEFEDSITKIKETSQ